MDWASRDGIGWVGREWRERLSGEMTGTEGEVETSHSENCMVSVKVTLAKTPCNRGCGA